MSQRRYSLAPTIHALMDDGHMPLPNKETTDEAHCVACPAIWRVIHDHLGLAFFPLNDAARHPCTHTSGPCLEP